MKSQLRTLIQQQDLSKGTLVPILHLGESERRSHVLKRKKGKGTAFPSVPTRPEPWYLEKLTLN